MTHDATAACGRANDVGVGFFRAILGGANAGCGRQFIAAGVIVVDYRASAEPATHDWGDGDPYRPGRASPGPRPEMASHPRPGTSTARSAHSNADRPNATAY